MANAVSFDESGNVRIIPTANAELCQSIVDSTKSFVNCVDDFESIIQQYLIDILESKATELKDTKLLAIGLKNQIINETELRKEKENELKSLIKSQQKLLKKLKMKHQSLVNVEQKQTNTMTKLQKF
eukprot:CAMPEP_0197052508 /NCGR_PEP_ID=MMETSP1384-20130603/26984_1 /TAXON_ID=29189 /ORGANISM="Ammonia sp." /LENGTH=126 /DNA_ID=CAMNT_0042485259 /DNA_START=44 /DNA_END=424 /DNA_ORIENTATION=-